MRSLSYIVISLCALTLAALLPACEKPNITPVKPERNPAPGGKLVIVTTTAHAADAARIVLGPRLKVGAEVSSLMGEGVDPHTYKLTRSDTAALAGADVVVVSGLHLEGKMGEAVESLRNAKKTVIELGEGLEATGVLRPEGAAGQPDPHFWMDPELWRQAVTHLARELGKADPDNAGDFYQNAIVFGRKLDELDSYARKCFDSIPLTSRVLVTSHDAFAYLGKRYKIEVRGVQGISTESEAGVKDVEELVDTIVKRKVKAAFIETSVSQRTIDALLAGARAQNWPVSIGGTLFSDALGPPGTYTGTYLGMMDHNITTITRGLGGTAPEGGMNNKLTRSPASAPATR